MDGHNILLRSGGYDDTGLQLDVYADCSVGFYFAPISYGQWRHVCVVNHATNWFFYDNGVQVGSSLAQCNLSDVELSANYLARSNWGTDRLLQGSISEFRAYNRSLTASEVAALHANIGAKPLLLTDHSFWPILVFLLLLEMTHTFKRPQEPFCMQ